MIWEEEQVPDDWTKGILVKLPKKGDRSICGNWRGIMLLSIPSKLLCHIILHRMRKEVDRVLRDEQAGFRQERSCTDQIATLRIIKEKPFSGRHPNTLHSLILRRHLIV